MEFPKYEHKYLSVFDNNEDYEEQTAVIHECNWSAIRDPNQTEEDENDYYPSVRPTNEDNKYVMKWYSSDELKKKFALEITWGYYGFEWVDYEYNGEILKGGNLYTIKEITKVPTIADGYRLQHINNFLNTQTKVTEIERFDTSNIISAAKSFYKGYVDNTTPIAIHINNWPSLENATEMFYGVDSIIYDENIINMPNVKIIDGMFAAQQYRNSINYYIKYFKNDNIKYKLGNSVISANNLFAGNILKVYERNTINVLDEYFKDYNFINCLDFSYLLSGSLLQVSRDSVDECNIIIDLKDGEFNENKVISLDSALYRLDIKNRNLLPIIIIDFIYNNNIIIKDLMMSSDLSFINDGDLIRFSDINKIKDCTNAFYGITFNYFIPIDRIIPNCIMTKVYNIARINFAGEFDYAPNDEYYTKDDIIGQDIFYSATINKDFIFKNVDRLYHCFFNDIEFSEPIVFNYDLINNNISYDSPRYVTFANSNIAGIKDQELSITYKVGNYSDKKDPLFLTTCKMFEGCAYIDFTNSNFTLNLDIATSYGGFFELTMFKGCSSMKTTPILKGKLQDDYAIKDIFKDCTSLEEIRGEELELYEDSTNMDYGINLSTSPNLKYIRLKGIGKCLNLQNCTMLDKDVLYNTFMNNTKILNEIKLMKNVFDQYTEEEKNTLLNKISIINVVENESE